MESVKFTIQTDSLFKDRLLFFASLFCFLCILAQASLILTATGKLPPQIPLFYSKPWGEAMLASALLIWTLPTIATVVFSVNFIISKLFFLQNMFLTRTLFLTSALVATATLYNTAKIISLFT